MILHIQKIFNLLIPSERKQSYKLFVLMVMGTFLETLSVGLIIPALSLMIQDENSPKNALLVKFTNLLGNPTQSKIIFSGVMVLMLIYLLKTLFLMFLTWKQNVFIYGVRSALSQRLFNKYLLQPWTFFLQRNSAQLINVLTNETNQFGVYALQPTLILLSEGLVLLAIFTLLVITEPLAAMIMMLTISLLLTVAYLITRNFIAKWGKTRQYHENLRIQHVQQGLGGAKEIKLLGREKEFLDSYQYHNLNCSHVVQQQSTMQQLPRLWLEFIALVILASLILVSLKQGKTPSDTLVTIALFAGAAFRLIPSATRIIGAMQSLRFADSVVSLLNEEASINLHKDSDNKQAISFIKQISIKNLSYKYPKSTNESLINISISIPKGSCVGFIGESGSGKSTLIDVMLGLLTPTQGAVEMDGINIQSSLRSWQDKLGYVPQTIYLTDDTLRRNIGFGIPEKLIDDHAVLRAIKLAQLQEFVAALPDGIETLVGERGVRLSGGQRQRIGIARALYHDPEVLVLDEATSALDSVTEEDVMQAVNGLIGEKTMIIVAHRLSTLARCDKVYTLAHGHVVSERTYSSLVTDQLIQINETS